MSAARHLDRASDGFTVGALLILLVLAEGLPPPSAGPLIAKVLAIAGIGSAALAVGTGVGSWILLGRRPRKFGITVGVLILLIPLAGAVARHL
jgi:hypothetical protein